MLHTSIEIRDSQYAGRGLIAARLIPRGTVVWSMDKHERQYRYAEWQRLTPESQSLCYQRYDRFVLISDGGQYMNHACEPNTGWRGDDALVSRVDILPGDEVTYDYATAEVDAGLRGSWRCGCGKPRCRKLITPLDCLLPEFQRLHAGYLPGWTLEFIAELQRRKP